MNKKILTVSVAAYNVQKYLHNLCDTIIASDALGDIEVLIVSDGSKDQTPDIAREYEARYPDTFRLIEKENGGHGSTINTGLRNANGKYFRALDGDDWVDSQGFKQTVDFLKTVDVDMVMSNYYECVEGQKPLLKEMPLEENRIYKFGDIADKFCWFHYHSVIYRTDLYREHSIRELDEKCFYVDSEFMLFPIPFVETVCYCSTPLYCYRLGINEQSVSAESKMKHVKDSNKVAKTLLNFYVSLPENMEKKKYQFITRAVSRQMNWHLRLLAEFGTSAKSKKRLIAFDQLIKKKSPYLYKEMLKLGAESKMMITMRKTNYLAYRPIAMIKEFKRKHQK